MPKTTVHAELIERETCQRRCVFSIESPKIFIPAIGALMD